jgi:hypothetical protein
MLHKSKFDTTLGNINYTVISMDCEKQRTTFLKQCVLHCFKNKHSIYFFPTVIISEARLAIFFGDKVVLITIDNFKLLLLIVLGAYIQFYLKHDTLNITLHN